MYIRLYIRHTENQHLSQCGLMFRLFSRVKTINSLHHKIHFKDERYIAGKLKIQDMIGLRIVLYFQDDVDALAFFYSCGEVVKSSIDELDSSTFRPQRLNLTCNLRSVIRRARSNSFNSAYRLASRFDAN